MLVRVYCAGCEACAGAAVMTAASGGKHEDPFHAGRVRNLWAGLASLGVAGP